MKVLTAITLEEWTLRKLTFCVSEFLSVHHQYATSGFPAPFNSGGSGGQEQGPPTSDAGVDTEVNRLRHA